MKTSTIAVICGAAIASAGITYYISSEAPTPLPQKPVATTPTPQAPRNSVSTPSAPSNTSKTPTTESNKTSSTNSTSKGKPDGIDDKTWNQSLQMVQGISMWANTARESGMMERMIEARVKSDAKKIADKLGMEGEDAEKIQSLLADRAKASTERTKKLFDAMLSNEDGLTTLLAIQGMSDRGTEISPDLNATKEAYKKEMFGEFYPKNGTLADDDLKKLFAPTRPESWYKDDEFIVTASSELGGDQGAQLVDYAGKLDYLDRDRDASNKVNRIERSVDLQPTQTNALKKLYIDNASPTDAQISEIVGPDKVEAVKSSSSRRGRGR